MEYLPLIKDIAGALKQRYGTNLLSAVLFGSVARGEADKGSDVDICLIFKDLPEATHQRTRYATAFEDDLRGKKRLSSSIAEEYYASVSVVEFTADELEVRTPVLFLDMIEDGIALIDDGTFETKVERLKQRMVDLGTRRIDLGDGTHTWALKKNSRPGEAISL